MAPDEAVVSARGRAGVQASVQDGSGYGHELDMLGRGLIPLGLGKGALIRCCW